MRTLAPPHRPRAVDPPLTSKPRVFGATPRVSAEQYQAFAKFNEDYISRSLKQSDLQYVS